MIVKSAEEQSEAEAAAACSQVVYKHVTRDHQRHFTADDAKIIPLAN